MSHLRTRPEKHVFICRHSRANQHPRGSCGANGSDEVFAQFAHEAGRRKLHERFFFTQCGCFGPCELGPNVLVYPEGTLYSGVKPEDVPELIDSHLLSGRVVERLVSAEW